MTGEALALLRCPACTGAVGLAADDSEVVCRAGHRYSVREPGYVDLSTGQAPDELTARTAKSFGYEWTTFDRVEPEDEDYWRWYFADVPLDDLAGRAALDAGCGKGRFTRFTAAHVGPLVALDASEAVAAAARNLADLQNVTVVRADLRDPPLNAGSLGFVSCLGVLHHLADPEAGFRDLVRLLGPGGLVLVYLYSRPEAPGVRAVGLRAAEVLRRLTVRLPHRLLRALAAPLAALLYGTLVLPGAVGDGHRLSRLAGLPLSVYRGKPLRALWLDTFDRLSAPVEHRYTWAQLAPWFDRAGMEVLKAREDAGWFVVARLQVSSAGSPDSPAGV